MSQNNENTGRKHVSFASIDQYVDSVIVTPVEKLNSARNMVEWGANNAYPSYLLDLYNNVTTLRSIINGNVDFIVGDDVSIIPMGNKFVGGVMNAKGDTIRDQVKCLARDIEMYGGFALNIIRSNDGGIAEIHYVDLRFLRTNPDCNVFFYSEKWDKNGRKDVIMLPKFLPNLNWASLDENGRREHASSILFVKDVHNQTYPAPLYASAVKACETERGIDTFHLSSIENSFVTSAIINFNNGDPGEKIKEEIEEEFNEKFAGVSNGSRIMFSWNKDRTSATTIEYPKVEDFGARYEALSKHSRQQIYSAFRAIPLLFGMTEDIDTGFSTDEYEQSFKLYNRTQIRPVQRMICDAYDKIWGQQGVLTIVPFSLGGDTEHNVD